jgi:hypothetical protein
MGADFSASWTQPPAGKQTWQWPPRWRCGGLSHYATCSARVAGRTSPRSTLCHCHAGAARPTESAQCTQISTRASLCTIANCPPLPGGVPQAQVAQQGGAQIAVQPPGAPGGAGAGVAPAPAGVGVPGPCSQDYLGVNTALNRLLAVMADAAMA